MLEQTTQTDDDDKRSSSRENPASHPRTKNVYRGVLATLREVDQCNQHSRDEEELRNTKLLLRRSTSRRKNSSKQSLQSTTSTTTRTVSSLSNKITNSEFTILFFFDPRQQHSLLLRSTISDFCQRKNDKVCCLAMFGGDPQAATIEDIDDFDLFYRGTGFLEISATTTTTTSQQQEEDHDNGSGQQLDQQLQRRRACILNLLKFLDVTQIPNVTIVPNSTGRPIMGQEMAMEWNVRGSSSAAGGDSTSGGVNNDKNDEELLQRWREGKSGLTLSQNILSKVLGDSNSVCTIM